MLNLDTHILIRAIEGKLSANERSLLIQDPEWSVSSIVLWEITRLQQIGRIRYGLDHPPLSVALDRVHQWPISRRVCLNLRALDFQSDPADEIIAATSLTHQTTCDTRRSNPNVAAGAVSLMSYSCRNATSGSILVAR